MKRIFQKRYRHWLFWVGFLGLVGSWRLFGCGTPGLSDIFDNPQTQQQGNTTTTQQSTKDAVPKATLNWTDTRLESFQFHYMMWRNKPTIWYVKGTTTQRRDVFYREEVGGQRLGLQPRTALAFRMEDLSLHDNKLYMIARNGDTRLLQVGQAASDSEALNWYTVRTFRDAQLDQIHHVTFLGHTMLVYGKKDLYTLNPNAKEPKLLKLKVNMLPNIDYMRCNDNFCVAVLQDYLPVMFSPTSTWQTTPAAVSWTTVPQMPHALTKEPATTPTTSATPQQTPGTAVVPPSHDTLQARVTLHKDQVGFVLREKNVYWSCKMGLNPFKTRTAKDNVRAVAWAGPDLLVVDGKRLVRLVTTGEQELSLPAVATQPSVSIHRLTHMNNALYLELTLPHNPAVPQGADQIPGAHRLYVAPYRVTSTNTVCFR
ncbi:MAG: hypothetical protein EP343_00505 [Deltaproteobacteria bacterium]|nr:MAG: hypothetical protein EP343_00505 [Deltaproteobacteria bacterium]